MGTNRVSNKLLGKMGVKTKLPVLTSEQEENLTNIRLLLDHVIDSAMTLQEKLYR